METGKDYLIQQLETCRTFSENIEGIIDHECSLHNNEEKITDRLTELRKKQAHGKNPKNPSVIIGLILAFPLIYAMSYVLTYLGFEVNNFTAILAFVIAIIIDAIITRVISVRSDEQFMEETCEEIKKAEEILSRINTGIRSDDVKLEYQLGTPEAQLVKEIIPPDYRKAKIIEKFIFFIKNGHADTIKEAVREYDNYIHNLKLEQSAKRQAEAAEASLAVGQQAAEAAERAAKAAQGAEFWSLYNAYLNEKR